MRRNESGFISGQVNDETDFDVARMTVAKFWNVDDLALFLGVPRSWVYDRTQKHGPEAIPHVKLGKYIRFRPESESFRRWLAAHERNVIVGSDTQQPFQAAELKPAK
jgi:hypothetical protein